MTRPPRHAKKPPPPSVHELRARVADAERELHASVDEIGRIVEDTLDWRKQVRNHPVQSVLVAAAVGFVLVRQPAMLRQVATAGLRSFSLTDATRLLGLGAPASILSGLVGRFTRKK